LSDGNRCQRLGDSKKRTIMKLLRGRKQGGICRDTDRAMLGGGRLRKRKHRSPKGGRQTNQGIVIWSGYTLWESFKT